MWREGLQAAQLMLLNMVVDATTLLLEAWYYPLLEEAPKNWGSIVK